MFYATDTIGFIIYMYVTSVNLISEVTISLRIKDGFQLISIALV